MEYHDFLAGGGLGSQLSRWVVVCDEHRCAVAPATTAQRIRHGGSHVVQPAVQVAIQSSTCCDLQLYANGVKSCQQVGRCSGRTVSRSSCPRSQPAGAATLLALTQYPAPASPSITLLLLAHGRMTAHLLSIYSTATASHEHDHTCAMATYMSPTEPALGTSTACSAGALEPSTCTMLTSAVRVLSIGSGSVRYICMPTCIR